MIMLSAVCAWHAIVSMLLRFQEKDHADYIEYIVLGVMGSLYVLFNVGFVIMIYLFVSKCVFLCVTV